MQSVTTAQMFSMLRTEHKTNNYTSKATPQCTVCKIEATYMATQFYENNP